MQDSNGKELNLDGTPRVPYRHPHFGQVTTIVQEGQPRTNTVAIQHDNGDNLEDDDLEGLPVHRNIQTRNRLQFPVLDNRRVTPTIKPAKMNIPEFDGTDADSWIQTIELYFESDRKSTRLNSSHPV